MKKILVVIVLLLLTGCTNKVEEDKYAYLEYKNNLEEQKDFVSQESLEFNTYFNLVRETEEKVTYSLVIDSPKVNMNNVKALLIHDFVTDDVFPSVGIFDEPVTLHKDSNDKIVLEGSIQTIDDISDTKFKLYLEYVDDDGLENNIYYEVHRG